MPATIALAVTLIAACRSPDPRPGDAETATISLMLSAEPTDSNAVWYSVQLQEPRAITIGAYRVMVHYDSTQLRFIRIATADSMLTAVNNAGGRVVIAGASTTGFGDGPWVRILFLRTQRDATDTPTLELFEVADVEGRDVRARIRAESGRAPQVP